jgi:hypothetical protein
MIVLDMGNKPSALLSDRDKLLEATRDTRSIIDAILQYLLDEVKITDLAALSSQTDCKKYVIALAGTLNKLFFEINLAPEQGKDGIIYFRPIKDLGEPKSESEKNNRQSLCIILSYFYVRIFQIFGALALTLMDDASAYTTSGIGDLAYGATLLAPGRVPFYMGGSDESKPVVLGGDIDRLGIFAFLRPDLDREETRFGHAFKNSTRTMYFNKRTSDTSSGRGTIYASVRGVKNDYIKINISATQRDEFTGNRITISINDISIGERSYTIPSDILARKSFIIERETRGEPYTLKDDVTQSPADALIKITDRLSDWVEKKGYGADRDKEKDRERAESFGIHGTPIDPLKIDKTVVNLRRDKPLAHCIARAMQLLSNQPIENKQTYSYICQSSFLETKSKMYHTGKTRAGLPAVGESLETSPGMFALSQLFFDFVKYGMPDVSRREPSVKQFEEFLSTMAKLYGDDVVDPKKLTDVKNRRRCTTGDTPIAVKSNVANSVYEKVKLLYQIQMRHTSNAGRILSQLFTLVKDPISKRTKIHIHPDIFKKGLKEIERINVLTRGMLIDYYKSCENVYQAGAEIIKKSLEVKAEAKPLVAPGAVPGKPVVAPGKPVVELKRPDGKIVLAGAKT